jgi:hypothetical protein
MSLKRVHAQILPNVNFVAHGFSHIFSDLFSLVDDARTVRGDLGKCHFGGRGKHGFVSETPSAFSTVSEFVPSFLGFPSTATS